MTPKNGLAALRERYQFTLPVEVRDYECDLQGIVNNAVYQHYLEHARHQFLRARGLRFAALAKSGIHLVVVRAELEYKAPLRSGESFVVGLNVARRSVVRFVFQQDLYRLRHGRLADLLLRATVTCAAMDARGKPMVIPGKLVPLLGADHASRGRSGQL